MYWRWLPSKGVGCIVLLIDWVAMGKSKVTGLVDCGGWVACEWLSVAIVDGRERVRNERALWMRWQSDGFVGSLCAS